MFKPISEAPDGMKMFVAIAVLPNYTTDPWCVWKDKDANFGFARWPHKFAPTHFMEIAETPKYQVLTNV